MSLKCWEIERNRSQKCGREKKHIENSESSTELLLKQKAEEAVRRKEMQPKKKKSNFWQTEYTLINAPNI